MGKVDRNEAPEGYKARRHNGKKGMVAETARSMACLVAWAGSAVLPSVGIVRM